MLIMTMTTIKLMIMVVIMTTRMVYSMNRQHANDHVDGDSISTVNTYKAVPVRFNVSQV